jgi:orotate phosphoribosyltransferase
MNHRDRLRELLVERSLEKGDFVLASGARSSYYIDARRTTFSAEGQYLVGIVGLQVLWSSGVTPEWVGGLTMGADPVACALAHRSWLEQEPIQAFSVRKEPKGHGTGNQIEGGLPTGARVVVVEDSLTTGSSALRAIRVLEGFGANVQGVLTVVDREAGGEELLTEAGYTFLRIFRASELLSPPGEGA